jgi:hypothetical protein
MQRLPNGPGMSHWQRGNKHRPFPRGGQMDWIVELLFWFGDLIVEVVLWLFSRDAQWNPTAERAKERWYLLLKTLCVLGLGFLCIVALGRLGYWLYGW